MCRGAGGGGAARAHCWRLSWMLAQAASVASRYAFGADGVGAARPGACGEADRRLALRARRSALRAQRRSPICVLHTRAPSASSACKGCSWCSARGAQLRRSAGRSARTRASARTPACRSAGTGHRAVQLCVRWCTSSAWRASRPRPDSPLPLVSSISASRNRAALRHTPGVKSRWRLRVRCREHAGGRIPHLLLPLRRFEFLSFRACSQKCP